MSLDISITNKKTGDSREMNWLRNPFGLCNWAEDNYKWITKKEFRLKDSLWYVINNWNYKKSNRVNRKKFKQVVLEHWKIIEKLERGYFFFDVGSFMSFVLPSMEAIPYETLFHQIRIKDNVFQDKEIGIPMEYFDKPQFHLGKAAIEDYKVWFKSLVEFAELLQDKDYKFYCSN